VTEVDARFRISDDIGSQGSSTSVGVKPDGSRGRSPSAGTLHAGQGTPAAPQPQAAGPSHGIAGWLSHTQKVSWQTVHVMVIDHHSAASSALRPASVMRTRAIMPIRAAKLFANAAIAASRVGS
jgi:hypothetical protein